MVVNIEKSKEKPVETKDKNPPSSLKRNLVRETVIKKTMSEERGKSRRKWLKVSCSWPHGRL